MITSHAPNKIKVLVVDDEPGFLQFVEEFLEDIGFAVVLANNGKNALDLFTANRPALVITDLFMPVMDGIALIEQIRKLDQKIPIIVMSGGFTRGPTYDGEALEQGANLSVAKNTLFDDLMPAIRSLGFPG